MGNCCRPEERVIFKQYDQHENDQAANQLNKRTSHFTFAKSRYSSESTLKLPPTFSDPALFNLGEKNSHRTLELNSETSQDEIQS